MLSTATRGYFCSSLKPVQLHKKITAACLLLLFSAYSFHSSYIIISYFTQYASYKAACVNKEKPALHCNGKCALYKKLAKEQSNTDPQVPASVQESRQEIFCGAYHKPVIPVPSAGLHILHYPVPPVVSAETGIKNAVFHPPCTC